MRSARKYQRDAVRTTRTRVWAGSDFRKVCANSRIPPKHLTSLNRANLEGDPVFYASAALPASFDEPRLSAGQYVVCSEWRNTMDMTLQGVGLSKDENALSMLSESSTRSLLGLIRRCKSFCKGRAPFAGQRPNFRPPIWLGRSSERQPERCIKDCLRRRRTALCERVALPHKRHSRPVQIRERGNRLRCSECYDSQTGRADGDSG